MAGGGRSRRSQSGRGKHPYDQALKLLGERWAPQLAALLYPGARLEEPLSGELPVTERRTDWLWRARVDGDLCALHVEFQLRGKSDMAYRMCIYASRILATYQLPPVGVLVYLVHTKPLAESPYQSMVGRKAVMTYPFEVVRLWELDPAPILGGELGALLPLVPLMRGAAPEQLPELAGKVLELPSLDTLSQADLITMLVGFGALRFPDANIWSLLRSSHMFSELIEELIEDSPFFRQVRDAAEQKSREKGREEGRQEGRQKGRQEGREEGREEGRKEGREEGHLEEARMMVRTLARARFPAITDADLAPLAHAVALDDLHALVPALAGAIDLEDALRLLRGVGV